MWQTARGFYRNIFLISSDFGHGTQTLVRIKTVVACTRALQSLMMCRDIWLNSFLKVCLLLNDDGAWVLFLKPLDGRRLVIFTHF